MQKRNVCFYSEYIVDIQLNSVWNNKVEKNYWKLNWSKTNTNITLFININWKICSTEIVLEIKEAQMVYWYTFWIKYLHISNPIHKHKIKGILAHIYVN